jgi:hypothetical protein
MSVQYAGGTNVNATFTGSTKALLQSNIVSNLLTAGWSQATGPGGGGAQTVTITIASPGVVTLAAHGLLANDSVVFATTGTLPTGITAGTRYFVKTVLSSGTFTISGTSGGSVINTSGSQSATQTVVGNVRMATAATAWSLTARVNIQDNGANCLTFSIENSGSTLGGGNGTSNGGYLLPLASPNYRIIANKYQAFIFTPITTAARSHIAFGTPYLPTFLQGVLTECGWMLCNAGNDTDGSVRASFRTHIRPAVFNYPGNNQGLANSTFMEVANAQAGGAVSAEVGLLMSFDGGGYSTSQTGLHWHDSSAMMIEPLIVWGNSFPGNNNNTVEALIRGQLWDAVIVQDTFAGDTTTTFDSRNWWGLTDNNSGDKATLFIVVP